MRNIAWHGFLSPSEVHPCFIATLIVITLDIGAHLDDVGIDFQSIPFRQQITFQKVRLTPPKKEEYMRMIVCYLFTVCINLVKLKYLTD